MSISINNNALPVQPSNLNESDLQLQTDQEAVDGTMRRNKFGQKKNSVMHFSMLAPSDYRTIKNYFVTGSGVYYSNDNSNETSNGLYAFSGLPAFTENEYAPGASLYRDFDVTIREI